MLLINITYYAERCSRLGKSTLWFAYLNVFYKNEFLRKKTISSVCVFKIEQLKHEINMHKIEFDYD